MSLFGTPQQQQTPFLFQPQTQQQQDQSVFQQTPSFFATQQQQQQQLYLFTNDKVPASYGTKWSDLHPDSQKLLLQIEERILEFRDESQRLDQCGRLYGVSVLNDGFQIDASRIVQELGGISTSMDRQKAGLQELTSAKDLLRNTEIAVRSYMMLSPRFTHSNSGTITGAAATPGTSTTSSQPANTSMMAVYDFYSGVPKKPSPFMQHTVSRFEKYLGECRQWIVEIEHLVLLNSDRNQDSVSLLHSLPKVMSNVHDFFVHVAAKVESIHQYIESRKMAYLADQRCRGDSDNPFLVADRRETTKVEAAAKRVHPTLHLPAALQPATQGTSLFSTSSATGTSTAGQTSTSGGLFSSPFPGPSSIPSLFLTPSTSAPTSSLFGPSTAATPQTANPCLHQHQHHHFLVTLLLLWELLHPQELNSPYRLHQVLLQDLDQVLVLHLDKQSLESVLEVEVVVNFASLIHFLNQVYFNSKYHRSFHREMKVLPPTLLSVSGTL